MLAGFRLHTVISVRPRTTTHSSALHGKEGKKGQTLLDGNVFDETGNDRSRSLLSHVDSLDVKRVGIRMKLDWNSNSDKRGDTLSEIQTHQR